MTYEEIQQAIGSIMISLAEPVTVPAHDYTYQPTNEYIIGKIDDVILELETLRTQIRKG